MSEVSVLEKRQTIDVDKWEREISPVMIMVGARAVEATLRLQAAETAPYEYVVPEGHYEEAKQAGWEEYGDVLFDSQQNSLLMTRYGKAGYDDLLSRGRVAEDGSGIAGLPDLYATMQYDGDTSETAAIRQQLLNPELPPLDLELMPREHKIALALLEKIPGTKDDPLFEMAERLLTHAIYTQYTLYGDPDIGIPNQLVGWLEKAENGTFAYYHNGFGLVEDSEDLLQHHENVNSSTRTRLLVLVAENYTDIVYAHGREADNQEAFDELLSAELLYQHALMLGCPEPEAAWMQETVELTAFNEKNKTQPGRTAKDPNQRSITASDLHGLGRRTGAVESSKRIVFENMLSFRRSLAIPLRQVMNRFNVWRLDTIEEMELFVWENRDEPVDSPDGETLGEVYYNYMNESADFHEDYEAPKGWSLDDPEAQLLNAAKIREDVRRFAA